METTAIRGHDLLRLPVRLNGIQLARATDLLLDPERACILALEVLSRDGAVRLLPLGAAHIAEDEIAVGSALTLIDDASFYRERGVALGRLRHAPVQIAGHEVGRFRDIVFGVADGCILELVVETDGDEGTLQLRPGTLVGGVPFRPGC